MAQLSIAWLILLWPWVIICIIVSMWVFCVLLTLRAWGWCCSPVLCVFDWMEDCPHSSSPWFPARPYLFVLNLTVLWAASLLHILWIILLKTSRAFKTVMVVNKKSEEITVHHPKLLQASNEYVPLIFWGFPLAVWSSSRLIHCGRNISLFFSEIMKHTACLYHVLYTCCHFICSGTSTYPSASQMHASLHCVLDWSEY